MTDEKTAAKTSAGDAYLASLEKAVATLRHLIVTLEGAPGVSPYTATAVVKSKDALAKLDEA